MAATAIDIVQKISVLVYESSKEVALTGVFSDEFQGAWEWDRKVVLGSEDSTTYNTFIGGESRNLRDGTKRSDWISGTQYGCELKNIKHPICKDFIWNPVLEVGSVGILWDDRRLYSDFSVCGIADYTESGLLYYLPEDAKWNSVTAGIYMRAENGDIIKARSYEFVNEFTGLLDGETRLSTVNEDGSPILGNVSDKHNEFLYYDRTILFNRDSSIVIGNSDDSYESVVNTWEPLGESASTGRVALTKYFPIDINSIQIVTVNDGDQTVLHWTPVSNLNTTYWDNFACGVNYDLGSIKIGGYRANDLTLLSDINDTEENVIYIYPNDNINYYPPNGIITIGSEDILYEYRTQSSFCNLTRGYNSTTAASHSRGDAIQDIQHSQAPEDRMFISYIARPRIEYEISDYKLRSADTDISVYPFKSMYNGGILQLASEYTDLAEIILTCDRPSLGGNLYGPLYYGMDTSRLTATALDSRGNPVEGLEITFIIDNNVEGFRGSDTFNSVSNMEGQSYASLALPYNSENMLTTTEVSQTAGNSTLTFNSTIKAEAEDIWVYQILKHDPFIGGVGLRVVGIGAGAVLGTGYAGYVEVNSMLGEEYEGGYLYTIDGSLVKRQYRIVKCFYHEDGSDSYTTIFTETEVPDIEVNGMDVWVLQPDAVEWSSTNLNGAKVILYEWNTEVVHPITEDLGAYAPIHPTSVNDNTLFFESRLLPVPDNEDDSNSLGGYAIISGTELLIHAFAYNPNDGSLIESNNIRVRVAIPSSHIGVGNFEGLPLPHGFKFVTNDYNIGAGLNGANFLTVNTKATGINQFTILGEY